jgi:hypothetical protein
MKRNAPFCSSHRRPSATAKAPCTPRSARHIHSSGMAWRRACEQLFAQHTRAGEGGGGGTTPSPHLHHLLQGHAGAANTAHHQVQQDHHSGVDVVHVPVVGLNVDVVGGVRAPTGHVVLARAHHRHVLVNGNGDVGGRVLHAAHIQHTHTQRTQTHGGTNQAMHEPQTGRHTSTHTSRRATSTHRQAHPTLMHTGSKTPIRQAHNN